MDARLLVIEGKVTKREVRLKLPTVIGRSRHADLTVNHSLVSREHCRIYELDGALVVRDNDSTNGTFVEGRRVVECVLKPGDRLKIGPLTFSVDYEHRGSFPALDRTKTSDGEATVQAIVPPPTDTVRVEGAALPPKSAEDTVGQGFLETLGRPHFEPMEVEPIEPIVQTDFEEERPTAADLAAASPIEDLAELDLSPSASAEQPVDERVQDELPADSQPVAESSPAPDDDASDLPAGEALAETQTWYQPPPDFTFDEEDAFDDDALPPMAMPEQASEQGDVDDESDSPPASQGPVVDAGIARQPKLPPKPVKPAGKGLLGWLPFGKKKSAKPASQSTVAAPSVPPVSPILPPPESEAPPHTAGDAAAENVSSENEPAPSGGNEELDSFLRKQR